MMPLLKFTLLKFENKPVPSLVSFSLSRDKTKTSERIDRKYIIWAICLHIRGWGWYKVFEQFEVRKQFLLHCIQNNCT